MNIPFLDLKTQYNTIKNEILHEINEVLDNTAFILGKKVQAFEEAFSKAHNAKYCYGVSSGTDGNHMVLWALGIGPGDEVILPANTFIATAWGATLCGAKPVFVDCHPYSYNIDPEKITNAITPKTKAIVAVHLYGQPADIDGIKEALVSDDFIEEKAGEFINHKTGQKIYLVEDCAQAHLSEYKGKKVGTLGIASSWSFYPGKNLGAYGEGGAVMTNDEELAKKFKMIRDHGAEEKYIHQIYGHNYRMEAIQGAVLGVKMKYIEKWTEERRRAARKYNELLKDVREIVLPKEMDYAKHVYHLFVIKLSNEAKSNNSYTRDKLQKFLNENGISTGLHYPVPLHLQPCFSHLGYKKGDFSVSEELAENSLSLPMFPELTDQQIEYIASKIKEFFSSK
ncbi:MAG: DegT/DnrJ/EryC1/StrS family aminotransferase [Ignavibacteria bacterium]|nr:DegT/DnrJ/EryC1/StrS family aminotransferase [Ignavibacteria bacterium]